MFSQPFLILAVVVQAGLLLMNWRLARDYMHPAVIQSSLWLVVFFLLNFTQEIFIPVAPVVIVTLLMANACFSFGALVAVKGRKLPHRQWQPEKLMVNRWILDLLLGISLVGLPAYLIHAYTLGTNGPSEEFLFNLRYATVEDIYVFGIYAYLGAINLVGCILFIVYSKELSRWKVAAMLLAGLSYASFSSGRTALFVLIISTLGTLAISRRISPKRALSVFAAVGLTAFTIVGVGTRKVATVEGDYLGNLGSLGESLAGYFLSPTVAMGEFMSDERPLGLGVHVFRFVFAVLERSGVDVRAVPLVQDHVSVPMLTNVYTFMQPYYADFGIPAVLAFSILIGFIHGTVYRGAIQNGGYYLVMYGLLSYPLLMQFFQDQYFNLLSTWLQLGLILTVFWWLTASSRHYAEVAALTRGVAPRRPSRHAHRP